MTRPAAGGPQPADGERALIGLRCHAQLLSGQRAATVEEVPRQLLAVQAQDPRGARLAVRARSTGLSAADVDRALTADRSVVISWLNRGTLHLVCAEDYWWLHPLASPQLGTGIARRLAQEGVPPDDAERGVAAIRAALESDGPLSRAELRQRVAATGVRTEGQAMVHMLALASVRGLVVRGPVTGREQAFALVSDWLGSPPPPVPADAALAELARRYLAGHAPATDRDLAKWAGITLGDARRGLRSARPASYGDPRLGLLVPRAAAGGGRPDCPLPGPRLLGAFDPVLLGWESRAPIVGPYEARLVVGGLFRPFVLVDGRAAGTWSMPGGDVVLQPFRPVCEAAEQALLADAADVRRFLTGPWGR